MVSTCTPPQQPEYINVRFHPPSHTSSHPNAHTRRRHRSPPPKQRYIFLHKNSRLMLRPQQPRLRPLAGELPAPPPRNPNLPLKNDQPHRSIYWRDYYAPEPLSDEHVIPKPISKIKYYTTKWKNEHPNPKTAEGAKAFYGNGMMPGMYPGAGMGMGMGMGYPGMGGMHYGMMGGGYGVS